MNNRLVCRMAVAGLVLAAVVAAGAATLSEATLLRMGPMGAAPKADDVITAEEMEQSSKQYGLVSTTTKLMATRYNMAYVGWTEEGLYVGFRTSLPPRPQQLNEADWVAVTVLPPGAKEPKRFQRKIGRKLRGALDWGAMCAETEFLLAPAALGVGQIGNGGKWGLQLELHYSSVEETALWHLPEAEGELATFIPDRDAPVVGFRHFSETEDRRQTGTYYIKFDFLYVDGLRVQGDFLGCGVCEGREHPRRACDARAQRAGVHGHGREDARLQAHPRRPRGESNPPSPNYQLPSTNSSPTTNHQLPTTISLTLTQDYDYDGFCYVTMRFRMAEPVKISSLKFSVPLKDEHAFCYEVGWNRTPRATQGCSMTFPAGEGEIWNSATDIFEYITKDLGFSMQPYFWFGGAEKGIAWLSESARGIAAPALQPVQRIIRRNGAATFEMNYVSRPTEWKAGEKVFKFGFQPTPVKPVNGKYYGMAYDSYYWPEWEMYKAEWGRGAWPNDLAKTEYGGVIAPSRIDMLLWNGRNSLRNGYQGIYYDCFNCGYVMNDITQPEGTRRNGATGAATTRTASRRVTSSRRSSAGRAAARRT